MENRTMFDFKAKWPIYMAAIRTPALQAELERTIRRIARLNGTHLGYARDTPVCIYFARSQPQKLLGVLDRVGFLAWFRAQHDATAERVVFSSSDVVAYYREHRESPFWWIDSCREWARFQAKIAMHLMPRVCWRLFRLRCGRWIVTDEERRYVFSLLDWELLSERLSPAALQPGLAYDLFVQELDAFSGAEDHTRVYQEGPFFAPEVIFQNRFINDVERALSSRLEQPADAHSGHYATMQ
jgi:hypothetical protein